MVEAELLSVLTQVITTAVLVGGMIFGAVRWTSQQAEKKAEALKETTEGIRKETKEFTTSANSDLKHLIESVDSKVTTMLSDLRKRADLTNGNVSVIRTEIADLQEDIQMIFDEKSDADNGDDDVIKSRKREQERKRRQKRRSIEADRVSQSERMLSRGD